MMTRNVHLELCEIDNNKYGYTYKFCKIKTRAMLN